MVRKSYYYDSVIQIRFAHCVGMYAAGIMGIHFVIRPLKAAAQHPTVYMSLIFYLTSNSLWDFSSIDDGSSSTAQTVELIMGVSSI